jgi:membrane-associated PAP2 superfamily phosphatase
MKSAKHIVLSLGLLAFCLVCFELTQFDLWVQNALFDPVRQQWLVNGADSLPRLIFYTGPKAVFLVFALCLVLGLLFTNRLALLKPYRTGIGVVLVSLILVPATVSLLKSTTNVACPRDLAQYGGAAPYRGLAGSGRAEVGPEAVQRYRCFPAGHASGGFALLSLFFLFRRRRNRVGAIALGLTVGWAAGIYKMAIGDHFLSHTVVSMLIAWLLINAIVLVRDWAWPRISPAGSSASRLTEA